ncbi:hypothetical protein A0U89_10785 [Kozakia baliensis]|uniref:Uncharacterized protein n=1 Tax=Kozakia baliensis TaxID=153496 RepID=A0A1D8UV99_9PROT|nr:hypothetical protein A0U89_10785 [Kozakia baliensis]
MDYVILKQDLKNNCFSRINTASPKFCRYFFTLLSMAARAYAHGLSRPLTSRFGERLSNVKERDVPYCLITA